MVSSNHRDFNHHLAMQHLQHLHASCSCRWSGCTQQGHAAASKVPGCAAHPLPAAALAAAAAAAAVRVCTCPQRHPWWGGRAHQGEGVTSDQQAHGWTRHTSSMQQQQQQHMALLLQPLHMPPAPPSSSLNRARTVQCDQGVIAVLTCLQPGASIVFQLLLPPAFTHAPPPLPSTGHVQLVAPGAHPQHDPQHPPLLCGRMGEPRRQSGRQTGPAADCRLTASPVAVAVPPTLAVGCRDALQAAVASVHATHPGSGIHSCVCSRWQQQTRACMYACLLLPPAVAHVPVAGTPAKAEGQLHSCAWMATYRVLCHATAPRVAL